MRFSFHNKIIISTFKTYSNSLTVPFSMPLLGRREDYITLNVLPLTYIPLLFISLMFWTNWNEHSPSIMRAQLSGSNVLVIISSDIRTPNGLAIDHRAEKLYFSDATLDKIERCEYDGSRRYVSQNLHPRVSSFHFA